MYIPVFSHPRSGSTFLMQLLSQANNVSEIMEPFHPYANVREANINEFLRRQKIAPANLTPGLVDLARVDPAQFLNYCANANNREILCVKCFPGHIDENKIEFFIKNAHGAIILKRNLVHSFISDEIATQTNKYTNTNTSDIKILFDSKKFKNWVKQKIIFLQQIEFIINSNKQKAIVVNYEDIIAQNMAGFISKMLYLGIELGQSFSLNDVWSNRQDQRIRATDKVTNPDELTTTLAEMGWLKLNDREKSMDFVNHIIQF